VHGRSPEFTFTIPKQSKIYESGDIVVFRELGLFKGKTACPFSPLVAEAIVYQDQLVTQISMESSLTISQLLWALDENRTLQQRHKPQVGELVALFHSPMRHSKMADGKAAMRCKHERRMYLSKG
jgi:hypothetical protein